jgi:hypothetical protein
MQLYGRIAPKRHLHYRPSPNLRTVVRGSIRTTCLLITFLVPVALLKIETVECTAGIGAGITTTILAHKLRDMLVTHVSLHCTCRPCAISDSYIQLLVDQDAEVCTRTSFVG